MSRNGGTIIRAEAAATGAHCVWKADARHAETPHWRRETATVEFIDGAAGEILQFDPAGARPPSRLTVAVELGFSLPAPGGGFVCGVGNEIASFDGTGRRTGTVATVPGDVATLRLNDAGQDSAGGIWTGTMDRQGRDAIGAIWRLDAAGRLDAIDDDFIIPNGFVFNRSGDTLYVADSPRRIVHSYRIDRRGISVARHSFFPAACVVEGYPDGMAIDRDDHLWIAFYAGRCVARFRPDGSLERRIELAAENVTACCFGGPDLTTLDVTADGSLFAAEVEVAGVV